MAAGLAVVVTLLLASSGMTDHLQQHWRRWAGDPGQACFDHERLSLADPDGARLEFQTVGAPDANQVTIRYRAHTGDGAGVDTEATCVLRGGRVSVEATVRMREQAMAARRFDDLVAEFDCLDDRKALLRAGKVDEANRRQCSR